MHLRGFIQRIILQPRAFIQRRVYMSTKHTRQNKHKRFLRAKFTTTLSIALVLFAIGLMAVGGLTTVRLSEVLREQFTITIEISECAPKGYGAKLASALNKQPYAKNATYISADSALTVLTSQLGENPENFLGYNPLLSSVELQLTSAYAVNDSIEPIVTQLKAQGGPNIESVDYNKSLVDVVNHNLHKAFLALAFIVGLLLLICMSLIGNAVRMSMYADRFLINTMQLVGATSWFIRRPFICQNVVCGLIASFVALCAVFGLLWGTMSHVATVAIIDLLAHPVPVAILVGCVVVPGILIPAIVSWVSAGRYLRRNVDDLYLM